MSRVALSLSNVCSGIEQLVARAYREVLVT